MTDEDEREVSVAINGGTSEVGDGVPTEAELHAMIVVFAAGHNMELSEADMEILATENEEMDMSALEASGDSAIVAIHEEETGMEEWETQQLIGPDADEDEMGDGYNEEDEMVEAQMAEQQEVQGDNMMSTEEDLENALFAGMAIQMGLMEQEGIAMWESLGGPTPAQQAQAAGLLTTEQVEWLNEPFHSEAEMISIVEAGPVIQMFTEAELEEVGAEEEYMIKNFLVEVGREDLVGNVIVLDETEKQMIYDYRIGERGLKDTVYAELIDGYIGAGEAGIQGTAGGGQLQLILNELQGVGTNRDNTEAIAVDDGQGDEREEWGCISGVIDEGTCGGCKSIIGTCGPMSELPDPPFHKHCRCSKSRA